MSYENYYGTKYDNEEEYLEEVAKARAELDNAASRYAAIKYLEDNGYVQSNSLTSAADIDTVLEQHSNILSDPKYERYASDLINNQMQRTVDGKSWYTFGAMKAMDNYGLINGGWRTHGDVNTMPNDAIVTHYGDMYERVIAQEGLTEQPNRTPTPTTTPMTYGQWMSSGGGDNSYAGQRKNATYAQAEAARAEAERLAEIERKRAVVDADTLEKQQRATYGQMAEQMGAMGLSGSGYSDYINSGAYAAGMAARQNANAKAAEAKQNASYAEHMAKLEADKQYATEKELAEKEAEALKRQYSREAAALKREEAVEEQTKYSNFINSIPEGATAEQIKALAKLWGIDDTKAQNAADYVTKYSGNTLTEQKYNDLETKYATEEAAGDFIGAAITSTEANHYNASESEKAIITARAISNKMGDIIASESQVKKLSELVSSNAYGDEGTNMIREAYSNAMLQTLKIGENGKLKMSKAEADEYKESVLEDPLLTNEVKRQFAAAYYETFEAKKKTINMANASFDPSDLGYARSNVETSNQYGYITEIKKAVDREIAANNNGEYPDEYSINPYNLKVGDIVDMNYGADLTDFAGTGKWFVPTDYYIYQGNGVFERLPGGTLWNDSMKTKDLYTPEGYKINWLGHPKKS